MRFALLWSSLWKHAWPLPAGTGRGTKSHLANFRRSVLLKALLQFVVKIPATPWRSSWMWDMRNIGAPTEYCPRNIGAPTEECSFPVGPPFLCRKRAEYCLESTVSEERTHWVFGQTRWVLRKTRWVRFRAQIIDWEELTDFPPRISMRQNN